MAFTRMTGNVDNISALSDRPNDTDGMSATALKAAFDAAGNALKTYINTVLIPEMEASGAENIGIEPIVALGNADNVQAALEAILGVINDVQAGVVQDGSVGTAKLTDLAVTTAKLSELAVTAAKIAALAVTTEKLADGAVTTEKITDANVTGAKIAAAAIGNTHLGSKVVKQANIDDSAVGTNQIAADAVTLDKTTGVQKSINAANVTLTTNGWSNKSQTVSISGLTANSEFVAAPNTAAGWAAAADAMVFPPTAGAGTLTFTCDSVPAANIPITVYWW